MYITCRQKINVFFSPVILFYFFVVKKWILVLVRNRIDLKNAGSKCRSITRIQTTGLEHRRLNYFYISQVSLLLY
jgi:hypothetical protein